MLKNILSSLGVQNISKAIGAKIGGIVGAGFGLLVAKYGLPAEFATVEIQTGVTMAVSGLFAGVIAYFFPENKK